MYPEVAAACYKSFGIFNLFNPTRPDGDYLLNLTIYEELQIAKLLCELARAEGWVMLSAVKLNNKVIEKMTFEISKTLSEFRTFECKYACPTEKVKKEIREKMGAKYFDWK